MIHKKFLILLAMWLPLCASTNTFAYEAEDAVPLTISVTPLDTDVTKVSIVLKGMEVTIRNDLKNTDNVAKRIGFTAYTPFFEQLGTGEDHDNKAFSDLSVTFNSTDIKPEAYRRGFFLGQDVTSKLAKAKIGPLPDINVDTKGLTDRGLALQDWQGFVSYSWVSELRPRSDNVSLIRYHALPQFGRDEISSDHFTRQIVEYCGNPDEIKTYLNGLNGGSDEVIFERYDIPIKYLRSVGDVSVQVSEPDKNRMHAKPLVVLMCGVSRTHGDHVNLEGTIPNPDAGISVLVISKLEELNDKP